MPTPNASAKSLAGNPVDARRDAAEDDRDDDHVRREDDLRGDLDQHVARAEGEQLPRLTPGDETPPHAQVGQLAPEPQQRQEEPERRHDRGDHGQRHEPAVADVQDDHREPEVEERAEQVPDVEHVVSLLAGQQVAEEADREAHQERPDGDEQRDLRGTHVLIRDLDDVRKHERKDEREQHRHRRQAEVDREGRRGQLTRLVAGAASPLLRGKADHGRSDPEVEQTDKAEDRADQRPDAELLGAERAENDRRDDQPGHERRGVDAVDQDHVAAEQPHRSVVEPAHRRDDRVRPAVDGVAGLDAAAQLSAGGVPAARVARRERTEDARQIFCVVAPEVELDGETAEKLVEVGIAREDGHGARCRLVDDLVERARPTSAPAWC